MLHQKIAELRPTWVEIDLDSCSQNIKAIKKKLEAYGSRSSRIAAVVKADGYGHGAVQVARTALQAGADWLAVAFVDEGLALREAGITAPILVLGWTPHNTAEKAIKAELSLTVPHQENARALSEAAQRVGQSVRIHIKVDTGMGRLGFSADDDGADAVCSVLEYEGLKLEGVFTHFSVADEDQVYTQRQIRRYRSFITALKARGISVPIRHTANSAAILDFPGVSFDMVRPGIMLYGIYPTEKVSRSVSVRPFLRWKTQVSQVTEYPAGSSISYGRTFVSDRPTTIATLPVGYADGYPRVLSNQGEVLIEGHRCQIAGRVCMDQTMVVVPDSVGHIDTNTVATLIGTDGREEITVDELAELSDTIAHEIFTGISKRVPRVFLKDGQIQTVSDVLHI